MSVVVQGKLRETPLERAKRLSMAKEPERKWWQARAAYQAELEARPPYEVFRLTQGTDIDVGGDEPPKHVPFLTLLLRINRIGLYNKTTGRYAAEFDHDRLGGFIVAEEPMLVDYNAYFEELDREDVPSELLVPEPLGYRALPVFWWARLVFGHRYFRSYAEGKALFPKPGDCCAFGGCGKPAAGVTLKNDWGAVYPMFVCERHMPPGGGWMAAD